MPSTFDVQLQDRDLTLLNGLFESRIMTVRHMGAIYFSGHLEAARKRVRRLRDAGYLVERARRVQDPAVFSISRKAYEALKVAGILPDGFAGWLLAQSRLRVANSILHHEIEVMDVKAAFCEACRSRSTLTMSRFTTQPQAIMFNALHPATGVSMLIKPDGFIQLQEFRALSGTKLHHFFLEVDRSTEALGILVNRVLCYVNYYKHGGFAERIAGSRDGYRHFPFRVLIVCKSKERRDNIACRLLESQPPVKTFVWLTTVAEIRRYVTGAIWVTPASHQASAHLHLFEA